MNILTLTFKSISHRKTGFILSVLLIAISVFLLLGIERVRLGARESFSNTISGVDVVVGGRTSSLNLVLFSIFRIGDATNNVSMETFNKFSKRPEVKFAIPISLGDSHKGYRVVGTDQSYFQNYKYSGGKSLNFKEGTSFQKILEVVIGDEVAKTLNYKLGDKITLSHGTGSAFQEHAEQEFSIVGILEKTSTPVDKSVHVSLEAIEAIHIGWESGAPDKTATLDSLKIEQTKFSPKAITAFFLALENRRDVLNISREVNDYEEEALTGALPGKELFTLWKNLGYIEVTLLTLSFIVFISSLGSLFLVLLSSLKERRREMAILRSLGATPFYIFSLYLLESFLVTISGIILGCITIILTSSLLGNFIYDKTGLQMNILNFSSNDFVYLGGMLLISLVVGIIPAIKAYQNSLSEGLIVRV